MSKGADYNRLIQSKRWKTLRVELIQQKPICERCQRAGYVRSSRCVHHVVPVESIRDSRLMEELFFSRSNLECLCYPCHSKVHEEMRSRTREGHDATETARLERFKSNHPAKSESRGGEINLMPPSHSEIHSCPLELIEEF